MADPITPLFDDYFKKLQEREARRKGTAAILGTSDPEKAAEGVQLGKELSVPPQAVMGAPDLFRGQAQQERAAKALTGAPSITQWLGDPVNGALAKDDLDNLTWFEKNLGAGGRAVGRGARRLSATDEYLGASVQAGQAADIGKTYDDIYAEEIAKFPGSQGNPRIQADARRAAQFRYDNIAGAGEGERVEFIRRGAENLAQAQQIVQQSQDIPMSETASRFRDGTLSESENTLLGTLGAFIDDPIGGAAFIAETAAETLPVLAAATAATMLTRTPAAGAAVMGGGSFLMENHTSALQFIEEQGVDVSTPEGAMVALQDAELWSAAQERGVTRGLVIALFDAFSGGVAGKTLMESPGGDMVAQGIVQTLLGSGGEATAQLVTTGELDWREVVIEGLAELATLPIEVVGVGGRRISGLFSRYGRSGETAERLAEIDEMAGKSKVRERSTDKFLEALQSGGETPVYVPASDMQEYFQAKDIELDEETLAAWGIDAQDFNTKVLSNGDVAMPVANYAARIAGTEDAPWFQENAVFGFEEMSVVEAQQFNGRVREIIEEEREKLDASVESERAMRAADVQIYDAMFSQLRAAGQSPDVAQYGSIVWSSFWRTMGELYSADPLDLARSMGVRVQGPQTPEVARRRGELDVMLNTLRSQGDRALAPRGEGVLDFVRSLGGVRDMGGDVEAMDAPKGLIAETAAQGRERANQPSLDGSEAEARGRGLDEIGRALIEAGYFPEYMGGANETADGTVVDEAAIALEAISEAIAGRERYIEGQGPDAALSALSEELQARSIDLAGSNDDIAAALEGDADGVRYDQSGRLITDSAEFKAWFGDSKVVDESGDPLVVYHGTATDFESFDGAMNGMATRATSSQEGFFFTSGERTARAYADYAAMNAPVARLLEQANEAGDRGDWDTHDSLIERAEQLEAETTRDAGQVIVPVYLSISNPMEFDAKGETPDGIGGINPLIQKAKAAGHDGVIIRNFDDAAGLTDEVSDHFIAFNPTQIKSVNNRGTFDLNDPRILYQADVEFASFKAAKEEADRLLDAIEEGGDAEAAFAAFSEVGNRREELAQAIAAEDGGIELKGAELFAAVTKSQNPDYSWRVTYFNDTGFLGHAEHKTKLEAVQSALDEGYTTEAEGALRTAMKARSFFQKYKNDKRGSVEFPRGGLRDGESVINLFESADLSTFLHESGHFFLEAFTALATADGAPAAMADDLAVIHKFLEVEDSSQIGTPQHEKWARGFEAYLMEGNAPSLELASAFARFKAWLTRIYKTVRGLNVKLTPEIREVMDRMLATDQEIAAMREDMGMRPLFTDAAPAGMSDADFATYQRMARRSAEQSEQALMKRTMEKVRRETLKWFKEEKAAVTKEVEARANKMPVYRAVEAMANGRWFDQESGEWRKLDDVDRLDRAALVERFGEGVLAELAKTQLGGRRAIYAKGGEEPGAIAELYGFDSVPDMIEALQNAGKRADYVTSEVDRIMVERHGDPLNDGSIEEAAALAVHSEQQAAMVTTEARAIAKRLGRSTRDIKAKFYKQRAKAMLGRMSVREASRPASFLQAERNAARRAERSFARVARGGRNVEQALAEAMQAKEQQILNHYLYQEARAFEQTLQRGRNRMMGYRKKSVREKLDGGYIEQIDALLEQYDFRVRSGPQIERAESLEKFVDRMIEEGRETELNIDMRLIEDARKTHYTRLSVEELLGLFDTITNIDHMGRRKQELIERQRRRVLDESASKVAGQIRANLTQRSTKSYNAGLRVMNLWRRSDAILIAMDEGDEIGTSYDELKRGIDEGAALEQQMQAKMADDFDALFTGHYSRKELRDMQKPQVLPGVRHEWTKQEILSLALNMGNEDNFKRVMDQNADETRRMDPQTLDALLSTLDDNDWSFVQGMWTMINSYWPDLAAVHKRRTGVEPRKVEARMMYGNAPASVTGGYFPIKYDPSLSVKAARDEESLWDRARTAGFGASAMVNNGMTKQRQATGGGRTVLYDLSVPFTHLRETTRFIALSEAVDATQRLLKHPEVAQAFMDTGNKDTLDTLQLWVEDVARGPVFNPDLLNTAFRMVKNNFTISRLAFNMKTAILQVTGLGQSAAVIGKRNMVRGMGIYARDRNAAVQDVVSISPLMAERQSTFQKDIYDFVNQASVASPLTGGARKLRNDVAKWGFLPIVTLQFYVVDMPTWLGAYEGEMQRSGDVEKARHYADRMVVRAQDSGLMADRAAIERGTLSATTRQSDVVRLFTTLGGYMLTKLNRVYVTGVQAKAGIKAADSSLGKVAVATSAAMDLTLLLAFEAALMGLINALLSDSEDEEDVKKFMLEETGMALIGGIPLVRDAASAFRGYGAGGVYGSFLEVPARLYTQAVQGENDKAFRRAVSDLVGIATGLPSTAAFRAIEAAINDDVPLSEGLFGTNPLDR